MPLVVRLERSNVIQMDHLEGVMGSACKWVCLDRDAQTIHHLTARALPNELCDHPVCDYMSFIFESLLTHMESMVAYLCVVDLRYDIEDLGRNME